MTMPFDGPTLQVVLGAIATVVGAILGFLRGRRADKQEEEVSDLTVLRDIIKEIRAEVTRKDEALLGAEGKLRNAREALEKAEEDLRQERQRNAQLSRRVADLERRLGVDPGS
jgi:chromosome segregation ATPase